jgi:predicted transcriptional regulator
MPDSALLNIVLASQHRMPLMMDLEEIKPRHIDAIASRRNAMVFEVAPSL